MVQDRLAEIFNHKRKFIEKLAPIYRANGFPDWSIAFDLDGRHDQEYFRLIAWRVHEELCEAIETYYEHTDTESYDGKFREEMADVLHFLIELCLAMGVSEGEMTQGREGAEVLPTVDHLANSFWRMGKSKDETIPQKLGFVSYKLGLVMCCLKQRPWRTDNRTTNRTLLVGRMYGLWSTYISACVRTDIGPTELYHAYFLKSAINDRRIADQKL